MLSVDKMEHWGSTGVQKYEIVSKLIENIIKKNVKRINNASETL